MLFMKVLVTPVETLSLTKMTFDTLAVDVDGKIATLEEGIRATCTFTRTWQAGSLL